MPFLNPLFLLALAAAAIPIALHLLNRRNPKPVAFSTLRFIETAIAKTRKSRHLTQVLILALRMLIILLLVLAFARPRLRSAGWLPEGSRTVVIVLDASASMRCRDLDISRFDQARNWALDLLLSLRVDDRVALVLSGAPPGRERVIFPPISNHGLVQKSIREAVCGFSQGDLVRSLQELASELAAQRIPGTVEIHLFSDMQQTAWSGERAGELGALLAEHDMRLFVNRTWAPAGNAWIEGVQIAPEAILGGGQLSARGVVKTDARFTGASTLHLYLENREAAQVGLPLSPGGEMPFALDAAVQGEGDFAEGRLVLDDDPLAVDNQYYFALARQEHAEVLLVDGTHADVPFQADAFYLAHALNPGRLENPLMRGTTIAWDALQAHDLDRYQAVMIANPPRITATLALKLEEYVTAGGSVLLYPGDAGGLEATYREIKPLAPLRMQVERFPATQEWRLVGSERPDALERQTRSLLRRLPTINGTARLIIELPDDPAVARSMSNYLQFTSEAPLAVRVPAGGGAFWISALAANRAWSEWPLSPLYVIMHQRLVRESFSNQQHTTRVLVGELAEIRWAGDERRLTGSLLEPGGKSRRVVLERATTDQPFALDGLQLPGIYRLLLETDPPRERYLAVNVAPLESQLDELSESELAASLGPATLFQSRDWPQHRQWMAGITRGQPLWPWLLLLAFLLGMIEEIVANVRSWGQEAPEAIKRLLRFRRT